MSLRSYRVSNLLIWTCVASYVEFFLFDELSVEGFAFLASFMHCQQGGEVWAWIGLLHAFIRFPSGFELFLSSGSFPGGIGLTGEGHRSDRCSSQVLGDLVHRSDRWCWPVWPVRAELLQLLCFHQVVCMHSSRGSCIGSGGACMCAGGALCVFELWFGGLHSLLEHSFVSDVSSRCPCLRGPRLVFFKWSCSLPFFGFRSLVGVSFYSFLFFLFSLRLLYVCVVNALIKGEIENHVWFEDRWMVTSWCDEWLTTLCGLILG
jgi:hypothetical protein